MNPIFKHLEKESHNYRMTHAEKNAMRARVFGAPVSASPFPSPYMRFFAPKMFAYALSAILVISGGTAYAAQGALPGTALYPIKVNVTERLETAFALTPEAKIEVNERIAERRVEEVTVLAENDTLDDETTAKLTESFDYHSTKAVTIANETIEKNSERTEKFAEKVTASINALEAVSDHEAVVEASTTPFETPTTMMAVRVAKESAPVPQPETEAKKNAQRFAEHARKHVDFIRGIKNEEE